VPNRPRSAAMTAANAETIMVVSRRVLWVRRRLAMLTLSWTAEATLTHAAQVCKAYDDYLRSCHTVTRLLAQPAHEDD
jgi:hypothetical protein